MRLDGKPSPMENRPSKLHVTSNHDILTTNTNCTNLLDASELLSEELTVTLLSRILHKNKIFPHLSMHL